MSILEAADGRDKALSEILATRLSKIPSVASFRREVLRGKLVEPKNVDVWILKRLASEGDPDESYVEINYEVQIGDEDDIDIGWTYYVSPDGVLGRLHSVAKELAMEHYQGWSLGKAVGFVLTNQALLHYATIEIEGSEELPRACHRIKMLIDPNMSIKEVAELYALYRNNFFNIERSSQKKTKPMSPKHLRLAVFTEQHRGSGTWDELREKWNREQPKEWHYDSQNTWNFARDAKKAWERVTGDKYRKSSKEVDKDV